MPVWARPNNNGRTGRHALYGMGIKEFPRGSGTTTPLSELNVVSPLDIPGFLELHASSYEVDRRRQPPHALKTGTDCTIGTNEHWQTAELLQTEYVARAVLPAPATDADRADQETQQAGVNSAALQQLLQLQETHQASVNNPAPYFIS